MKFVKITNIEKSLRTIFISSQDGNSFPYQILSTSVYKYNKIRTRDRLIENYLPKKKQL